MCYVFLSAKNCLHVITFAIARQYFTGKIFSFVRLSTESQTKFSWQKILQMSQFVFPTMHKMNNFPSQFSKKRVILLILWYRRRTKKQNNTKMFINYVKNKRAKNINVCNMVSFLFEFVLVEFWYLQKTCCILMDSFRQVHRILICYANMFSN